MKINGYDKELLGRSTFTFAAAACGSNFWGEGKPGSRLIGVLGGECCGCGSFLNRVETVFLSGVVFSTGTFSSFTGAATDEVAGSDASVAVAFSSFTRVAAVAGSAS